MIYSELTKKAMLIAHNAHKDQFDKAGIPYIYHPIHLAEQMEDEISTCVALLHDVVEDTDISFEDLLSLGIPENVIDALNLLTHEEGTPYLKYILRIKESSNKSAIKVKLADLRHNLDLSRFDTYNDDTLSRVKKYEEAIKALE